MKLTKELLLTATQELIETMQLKDNKDDDHLIEVNEDSSEEFLRGLIIKSAPWLEPGEKKALNPITADIVKELCNPDPDNTTLEDDIEKADTLKVLRNIAKAEDAFKSIRGKLMSYKDVDILKGDMLELLSPPEDADEVIEEKIVVEPEKNAQEALSPKSDTTPSKTMKVSEIKTKVPFNELFAIDLTVLKKVRDNMEENGYDIAFPIVLWGNVVLDGHTRLQAAKDLELEEVPVDVKQFDTEKEALEYSIHNQRDRRNLSDAELLACIEALDTKMTMQEAGAKGGKKEKTTGEKSHEKTAKKLKVSKSKVSDARTVLKDEKATEEVKAGKKSISKAAKEVRAKDKPEKEEATEREKTRIDAVAQVMINMFSGGEYMIADIAEEADILFVNWGGKASMTQSNSVTGMVLEVLAAFGIVKFLSDEDIEVKDLS